MSKADQQFVTMCRDILDHGTTTEGQKVRPVWEDGTPAYTIKNFGVTARYDLREESPALLRLPTAPPLLLRRVRFLLLMMVSLRKRNLRRSCRSASSALAMCRSSSLRWSLTA